MLIFLIFLIILYITNFEAMALAVVLGNGCPGIFQIKLKDSIQYQRCMKTWHENMALREHAGTITDRKFVNIYIFCLSTTVLKYL